MKHYRKSHVQTKVFNRPVILTLFLAPTSDPSSISLSKIGVRLSLTAYISGVIPVACEKQHCLGKRKKTIKKITIKKGYT